MAASQAKRKGFVVGMGTMLMATIGADLFGTGGTWTYVGFIMMLISLVITLKYAR